MHTPAAPEPCRLVRGRLLKTPREATQQTLSRPPLHAQSLVCPHMPRIFAHARRTRTLQACPGSPTEDPCNQIRGHSVISGRSWASQILWTQRKWRNIHTQSSLSHLYLPHQQCSTEYSLPSTDRRVCPHGISINIDASTFLSRCTLALLPLCAPGLIPLLTTRTKIAMVSTGSSKARIISQRLP